MVRATALRRRRRRRGAISALPAFPGREQDRSAPGRCRGDARRPAYAHRGGGAEARAPGVDRGAHRPAGRALHRPASRGKCARERALGRVGRFGHARSRRGGAPRARELLVRLRRRGGLRRDELGAVHPARRLAGDPRRRRDADDADGRGDPGARPARRRGRAHDREATARVRGRHHAAVAGDPRRRRRLPLRCVAHLGATGLSDMARVLG